MDAEITRYTSEIKKTEKLVKAGKPTLDHVKLLDEYAAGHVAWIEELSELSEKLPPAEAVLVQELKGNALVSGGRLTVSGGAKLEKEVSTLEANLRDEQHRVAGQGVQKASGETRYPFQFEETLTISPTQEKGKSSKTKVVTVGGQP